MSLPEVSESLSSDLRAIAMRRGGGRLGNLYVVNGKKAWTWLLCLVILFLAKTSESSQSEERTEPAPEDDGRRRLPIVISTWGFVEAVGAAWKVVDRGGSPVDAVVAGCSTCERLRCDGSVGYGGSPDENGETTLDAMIMDGTAMDVGAVGALRSVKDAIGAARLVMDHTDHTLLVGDQASAFAISLGLSGPANLSTQDSLQQWMAWRSMKCQPNFWLNVDPDARKSCGPYQPDTRLQSETGYLENPADCGDTESRGSSVKGFGRTNHDTISMVVIDKTSKVAAGTSTNGATHKIPGRVGDGPIAGAAGYADDEVGGCGATGDGDVMMRFLPCTEDDTLECGHLVVRNSFTPSEDCCYQVVESMRQGLSPKRAAKDAIARIKKKYPLFVGAVFAVSRHGIHAGACNGWTFQYAVRSYGMDDAEIHTISPDSD